MGDDTVAVETEEVWPDDSEDIEEAIVANWFVREGSVVTAGDPIAEIQIEKVSIDVPAPVGGEIVAVLVEEQDEFRRGDVLARISPS
ncbi:lipoyl domain-containing protein [Halococcus saccharolyticus]|uniref:Lipoyl-binding domain-containing protein n=1 Tax=Halococcus saccharolyticus DSM 5350 TaxID=1227455 RepID=M0MBH2_9EURY|nr:lipoyl domain-containing protein [Halococcus saccharolyticus]EMA43086.1 lipoyl-binding domain-containing protein [Halococcus saccharolyticus DSM 5350]